MRVLRLLPFVFLLSLPLVAQQTTTPAVSDPQAVAVVQAAITAIGGATAIGALQSWTFQGKAEGRVSNGAISEGLALSSSTTATPPPWATPRSFFVPALVSAILLKQSQDPKFSIKQAAASLLVPNSAVVVFAVRTKAGSSVPAQRWYFDSTSGLPSRVEFMLPAKVAQIEGFPGVVTLSNYQAVGSVLYPFHIVTYLPRENASEVITLQSVTPSTTAPSASNTSSGGAQ